MNKEYFTFICLVIFIWQLFKVFLWVRIYFSPDVYFSQLTTNLVFRFFKSFFTIHIQNIHTLNSGYRNIDVIARFIQSLSSYFIEV